MLSDHSGNKLEKKIRISQNVSKYLKMKQYISKQLMNKEEITRKLRKYLVLNDNENISKHMRAQLKPQLQRY